MPRTARMIVNDEATVYHVISRTALDGYPLGDVEKEFFHRLLRDMARVYFVDIMGFCLMGSHFHLLVRTRPGDEFPNNEVQAHFEVFYGQSQRLTEEEIDFWRSKWCSLSEFMRECKLRFSRFCNRRHGRRGYFWGDRYKSLLRPV